MTFRTPSRSIPSRFPASWILPRMKRRSSRCRPTAPSSRPRCATERNAGWPCGTAHRVVCFASFPAGRTVRRSRKTARWRPRAWATAAWSSTRWRRVPSWPISPTERCRSTPCPSRPITIAARPRTQDRTPTAVAGFWPLAVREATSRSGTSERDNAAGDTPARDGTSTRSRSRPMPRSSPFVADITPASGMSRQRVSSSRSAPRTTPML